MHVGKWPCLIVMHHHVKLCTDMHTDEHWQNKTSHSVQTADDMGRSLFRWSHTGLSHAVGCGWRRASHMESHVRKCKCD